jgi:hypothetical protein
MVAVPLTALWIMPWAIAAFALMPFGAEALALVPMGWGIEAMLAALARDGRALADDCAAASVVVSREPVRGRCMGPRVVIDRFDLWRRGGHALWLSPDGVRVETVRAHRGERPWVRVRGGR